MGSLIEMPDREEFIKFYLSGASENRLMSKYYVSMRTINTWAKKFGISRKSKDLQKQDLEKLLKDKLTYKQIGKKLNCCNQTVRAYLIKFGLAEVKPGRNKTRKKLIDKNELYNLRINECWTYENLALHFNVSRMTIFNRCKEYNFPNVLQDNKNHIWKRDGGYKNVKS